MSQEIGLFEALYTQRAIRYFRPDPVPDEMVSKLIESATKAPSGTNRQPWRFVVVRDADSRQRISDYYRRAWDSAYGNQAGRPPRIDPRIKKSAAHLAETMHSVPVLILACVERGNSAATLGTGASIFPAVQNLLLAARGLGLGSALTTIHKQYEREIKELLGIPESVETVALLPVGYPSEQARYGPTSRRPVREVTWWDRWGNREASATEGFEAKS